MKFFFCLSIRGEKKLPSVYRDKKKRKKKDKKTLTKSEREIASSAKQRKTKFDFLFIERQEKNKETDRSTSEFVASIELKTIRECVMYFGPAVGAMDCTTTIHRKRRKRGSNHLQSVCLFDIVDSTTKHNRSARTTSVTTKTSSSQIFITRSHQTNTKSQLHSNAVESHWMLYRFSSFFFNVFVLRRTDPSIYPKPFTEKPKYTPLNETSGLENYTRTRTALSTTPSQRDFLKARALIKKQTQTHTHRKGR